MMARILLINGPNLNMLGRRSPDTYGSKTLPDIESLVYKKAEQLGVRVDCYQSNSEGAIVEFIQVNADQAQGIIVNPGALTHYGYSLRDALADSRLPVIEVHLSNIYAREEWRRHSVIAEIAKGQIAGLGWRGYLTALEFLIDLISEEGHA